MDRRQAIARARRGHQRGFSWLFTAYRGRIFAFVRRTYGLDEARASDALQNTFVRAFNALDQLEDPDRFEPWLLKIARREALRVVTAASGRRETAVEIEVECTRQTQLAEQAELERLRRLIREVAESIEPPEIRETALAYYFGERKTTEALAAELGVPHPTVRKRLHSFRTKLKRRLAEETT